MRSRKRRFRTWDYYSDSSDGEFLDQPSLLPPRKRRRITPRTPQQPKSNTARALKLRSLPTIRLTGQLTMLEATLLVLEELKKPATAREICDIVIARNLISTAGKTPQASIGAKIYSDMKELGPKSTFVKCGRGLFGLRRWPGYEAYPPHVANPAPRRRSKAKARFRASGEN